MTITVEEFFGDARTCGLRVSAFGLSELVVVRDSLWNSQRQSLACGTGGNAVRIPASALNTFLRNISPAGAVFDKAVKPIYVFLRESVIELIEWRYGIRTRGRIELSALGLGAENNRKDYMPSGWTTIGRILRKREVGPRDVFIDFGSGLGRVVFQAASRYRFQRVVGVELCEQLNEVAKANIERNRHRLRCKDIQLITSDALNYEIPDDASVAYFANPFTGIIFETVIQRLLSSVDRNPRRLRIIYYNPVEHGFLMATGRLRLIRRLHGFRPTPEWSRSNSAYMYEVIPQALAESRTQTQQELSV